MAFRSLLAALVLALPVFSASIFGNGNDRNPFAGNAFYANQNYAKEVQQSINAFTKKGDKLNAARAKTIAEVWRFLLFQSMCS